MSRRLSTSTGPLDHLSHARCPPIWELMATASVTTTGHSRLSATTYSLALYRLASMLPAPPGIRSLTRAYATTEEPLSAITATILAMVAQSLTAPTFACVTTLPTTTWVAPASLSMNVLEAHGTPSTRDAIATIQIFHTGTSPPTLAQSYLLATEETWSTISANA